MPVFPIREANGKGGVFYPYFRLAKDRHYVKLLRTPLSLFLSYPALPAKIKIKRASLRDFPPPPPLLFILISPAPSFEPRRGKSVQRPIRLIGKTIKITLFFFPLIFIKNKDESGTGGAAKNKGRRMGGEMLNHMLYGIKSL